MSGPVRYFFSIFLGLSAGAALAQLPAASTFINRPDVLEQVPPLNFQRLDKAVGADRPGAGAERVWRIGRFHVLGASLVANDELQQALAPFVDVELSAGRLAEAAQAVVGCYARHGWLVRVALAVNSDGSADLRVRELRFGQLRVDRDPAGRAGEALVDSFIGQHLTAGQPLPVAAVERGTTLLNATPGVAAASVLEAGKADDEADLVVRLRDRPLLSGQAFADNHGLREIGQARLGGSIRLANGLGIGEQSGLAYTKSEFSHHEQGNFSLPLGGDGLRVGVSAGHFEYRAGRVGAASGLAGTFDKWRTVVTWPLLLHPDHKLWAAIAYDQAKLRDEWMFGEMDKRRVRRWSLALNDKIGNALVATRIAVEFSVGRADLSGNAVDLAVDALSTRMHGDYSRFAWRLSHERRLDGGDVLLAGFRGQLAGRNLEPSLKFALGGPDGVRAYPFAEALGDAGWLLALERKKALLGNLHGSLFVDVGHVTVNRQPWTTGRNQYSLAGAGASLDWQLPDNYLVHAILARQIGSNPGRDSQNRASDGRDSQWRFWLSLVKSF